MDKNKEKMMMKRPDVIENIKNSERSCFTWEKVVNKHAEVYRDVVAFRAKDQKMYEL